MIEAEFTQVMALLEAHWHQDEAPDEALAVYLHELDEFSFEHVQAAVLALAREGKRRMPYAGEIRRKVVTLQLDPPPWSVATADMARAAREVEGWREPDECVIDNPKCRSGWVIEPSSYELGEREIKNEAARPCGCQEEWREMRRPKWLHPLLRAFADHMTYTTIREALAMGDTTREAQLRNKYDAFVNDAIEQRLLAGINAPGMRAVERAKATVGSAPGLPTVELRELPA